MTADVRGHVHVVLRWLATAEVAPPFEVPGTSLAEQVRLAALGSLVAATFDYLDLGSDLPALEQHVPLKEWMGSFTTVPPHVVEALAGCLASDPEGALASIYSGTVSSSNRRRLGTFFTPAAEVAQMLAGCARVGLEPRTVVDVGAGVGIFTAAARRKWKAAIVLAVDINPVTLGLLGLLAASQQALASAGRPGVQLVLADFVDFAERQFASLPGPRLILGNPPYTRMQLLPSEERSRLLEAAGALCGSRASLSAIITAISLRQLRAEDGIALLLPAQWLEADYARELRAEIWSMTRRTVDLHMFRADLFSDAQVDAVSLLVGPERSRAAGRFSTSTESSSTTTIHPRNITTPPSWRRLFGSNLEDGSPGAPPQPDPLRLSEFATVKRGVATGANWFFVLTDAQRREYMLPNTVLRPMLRRLRDHLGDVLTQESLRALPEREQRWLLIAAPRKNRNASATKYIAMGLQQGVADGVLCSERRDWFNLRGEVKTPDVIVGPSTKDVFRFVENLAGSPITNNLYGLIWRPEVGSETRRAILTWLRSAEGQSVIASAARSQGAGLLKIEPRALSGLRLPARFKAQEAAPR